MRRRASSANLGELCSAGTPLGVSCSDLVLRRLVPIELRLLEPLSVPSMPSPETRNMQLASAKDRPVSPERLDANQEDRPGSPERLEAHHDSVHGDSKLPTFSAGKGHQSNFDAAI